MFSLAVFSLASYGMTELFSAVILELRPTPPTRVSIGGGMSYRTFSTNKLPSYPGDLSTDRYGFVHNGDKNRIIRDGDIFILGGSTVEGRGSSSNNATISAFLEKCARKKLANSTINVVNLGFSGDNSSQQYSRLISSVLIHFRPSKVIYLDGRNDAHYAVSKEFFPEFANHGLYPMTNPLLQEDIGHTIFPNSRSIISRISNKFENAKYIKAVSIIPMPDLSPMSREQRVSAAERNWREISLKTNEIALRKGFQFYHFLQPTLALSKEAANNKHFKSFFNNERGDVYTNAYLDTIRRFYLKAQNTLSRFDHIYDITESVPEEPGSYTDSVHYNDNSNKAIADKICSVITLKGS